MARVKGGNKKNRRNKILKLAKGYFGSKHRLYKTAIYAESDKDATSAAKVIKEELFGRAPVRKQENKHEIAAALCAGIKCGKKTIAKIPNPKPLTRCTKPAPMPIRIKRIIVTPFTESPHRRIIAYAEKQNNIGSAFIL